MKCTAVFVLFANILLSHAMNIKHYKFATNEKIIPLLRKASSYEDDLRPIVYELDQDLIDLINEKIVIKDETCFKSEACALDWMREYNYVLGKIVAKSSFLEFNYETNITEYNEDLKHQNAPVFNRFLQITNKLGAKFLKNSESWNEDLKRMIFFVSQGISFFDIRDVKAYSILSSKLESIYATAKVCNETSGACLALEPELTKLMAHSRDYDALLWAWKGWHAATGAKMRHLFTRTVQMQNKAAVENNYPDVSEYWISDFEEENFENNIEHLLNEIQPLYDLIHEYVRNKLQQVYGHKYPPNHDPKLIPAHLLGNMWAQKWENIFDLVKPYPDEEEINLTAALKAKNYNTIKMFEESERFFTSLGLPKMTPKFWAYSMLEKPNDRDVVCHASAHDLFDGFDFRIKMCSVVDDETFVTIHHEMGHIEYDMAYSTQPAIFRNGANSAFHEAIGDTIALSVLTPAHFKKINIISNDSMTHGQELNYLMNMALRKVVFLPFAYLIDKWRWDVFRGKINETNYNQKWWEMRMKYQGIEAPVPRSESDFDAGAKFHVAAYVPYARYFISHFLQFQFYEALCAHAGYEGTLHKCDFYGSKNAGEYLDKMLKLGASKHWSYALQVIANQTKVSAEPLLKYFKPLEDWLREENAKYGQENKE